jgi:uncharacterized protein YcaQ
MNPTISKTQARRLWIRAQGLDRREPFGLGAAATPAAVEHLGYVQIDTINVIERCHHHILYTRIPDYRRADLHRSQTLDKSVFEYWTHALSYVPTKDFRFFARDMRRMAKEPGKWFAEVKKEEMRKVLRLIRRNGAISIRDIDDDVLVEKRHEWASRKPSKKALQLGFYTGKLAISERQGMLKRYELADRHFNWIEKPRPARDAEITDYLIDRALRAQGLVSLDSICHLNAKRKPAVLSRILGRVRRGELVPIHVNEIEKIRFWARPGDLTILGESDLTHLLSPFDPLVIQRKRLKAIFDYEHIFEAYIPKEKRVFGYFALPVLIGDRIVAAVDLKTDRAAGRLLVQKWTWLRKGKSPSNKAKIEDELHRFEKFQLDH